MHSYRYLQRPEEDLFNQEIVITLNIKPKKTNNMKSILKTFMVTAALAAMGTSAFAQGFGRQPVDDGIGYKDTYKDYFTIGVAVNMRNISNEEQVALIKRNFNSITAENDMKPGSVHPRPGVWNWTNADRIANFCRENGIKLRGHCLCWHSQFCDWMFTDAKGNPVSKEVFYDSLRVHIHTVMNRYKDIVYAWDVVNEAISDGGGGQGGFGGFGRQQQQRPATPESAYGLPASHFRQSRHYQLCGDEFIAKAFQFAREADPKAILIYNDYNAANPDKRDRIYDMVKAMKAKGVPIDGIGMQGHYNIYGPTPENIEAAVEKYSTIVDHIHMTELDIRANEEMGGQLQFSRGEGNVITDQVRIMQEHQYAELFKIMRRHKDKVDNVTFWNLGDRDSWVGVNNYPLPFDENYRPKRVYRVIRDFDPKYDNAEIKEDFKPSSTCYENQEYPQVNSQGYGRFRIYAPQARSVIVTLGLGGSGGTVLTKGTDGYWTGTTSPITEAKKANGFSRAWLHHRGRNPHHWAYWTDNYSEGLTTYVMPEKDFTEMVCDFLAAGRAYSKNFTYRGEYEWWLKDKEHGNKAMNIKNKNMLDVILSDLAIAERESAHDKEYMTPTQLLYTNYIHEVYKANL